LLHPSGESANTAVHRASAGSPQLWRGSTAGSRVIPLRDIAGVRALLPSHRYLEIAGAEHNLLLTHPEFVAAALLPQDGARGP